MWAAAVHGSCATSVVPSVCPKRAEFCQWLLKMYQNLSFLHSILFSDEAGFTPDGITNFYNTQVWTDENSHAIYELKHQYGFSINMWAGVVGGCLIGPYFLPNWLTGEA